MGLRNWKIGPLAAICGIIQLFIWCSKNPMIGLKIALGQPLLQPLSHEWEHFLVLLHRVWPEIVGAISQLLGQAESIGYGLLKGLGIPYL